MRTPDEKCLHFVLHHYQKNKLDTQKALKAFKEKYQITEQTRKSFRLWWILPGMVAAILVVVLIYLRFRENGAWKEVTVPAFLRPFPRKRLPEFQPQGSHGR